MKINPTKIIGFGYAFKESYPDGNYPKEPVMFLKGTNAIIYNNENVVYPRNATNVWMEGELAIVMGKNNQIRGYTIANDITAENIYGRDHHLARSKSFDTFCPIGPIIREDIKDANNLYFESYLNGRRIQQGRMGEKIYTNEEIVDTVSKVMTLYPDDIILTGTSPRGIMKKGIIHQGDKMYVYIEDIGILSNMVI